MKSVLFIFFSCYSLHCLAQDPPYTKKHFVRKLDTSEFKPSGPVKNGIAETYIEVTGIYHDVDDNNTTHVRASAPVLLYLVGEMKNGKHHGLTRQYLIDSADHSKRFLINDQMYKDGKLNGVWNEYNLKGTLVRSQNFKDDSAHGIFRQYWIDGKTIMSEADYINGKSKFIQREYGKNGKVAEEFLIVNGEQTGEVKIYYETGVLQDKFYAVKGSGKAPAFTITPMENPG